MTVEGFHDFHLEHKKGFLNLIKFDQTVKIVLKYLNKFFSIHLFLQHQLNHRRLQVTGPLPEIFIYVCRQKWDKLKIFVKYFIVIFRMLRKFFQILGRKDKVFDFQYPEMTVK